MGETPCPECDGTGNGGDGFPCPACYGSAFIAEADSGDPCLDGTCPSCWGDDA